MVCLTSGECVPAGEEDDIGGGDFEPRSAKKRRLMEGIAVKAFWEGGEPNRRGGRRASEEKRAFDVNLYPKEIWARRGGGKKHRRADQS